MNLLYFLLCPIYVNATSSCLLVEISSTSFQGPIFVNGSITQNWQINPLIIPSSESLLTLNIKNSDLFSVQSYHHDEENFSEKFKWVTVEVHTNLTEGYVVVNQSCSNRPGINHIKISLALNVEGCEVIHLKWTKVCGRTKVAEGLNVGFTPVSSEIVKNGLVNPMFLLNSSEGMFSVSDTVSKTAIFVHFNLSSGIYIDTPYIICANEIMSPALSGELMKTDFVGLDDKQLVITYNCKGDASKSEKLELVLGFTFVDPIHLKFTKKCSISTQSEGSFVNFLLYVVLIALVVLLACKYYQNSSAAGYTNFGRLIRNWMSIDRMKRGLQPAERELPEFEEEDLNNRTVNNGGYGTI